MNDADILIKDRIKAYISDYMEKVFYFSLKKTGTREDAEDLASDISQCVLIELKKGVVPEYFSGWVWKIARNRYSKWAVQNRKKNDMISGCDIDELSVADERNFEQELIHDEEIMALRRELALVSSEYREILVAHYIEDRSVKDIASKLHISEGAIKMRLLRARKILKEGMNMSREFGKKSYKPEEVCFASSGCQPSGLPFSAVQRKLPKNILLEANDNPQTLEELSIEIGVAMPYMEEEVAMLVEATLLKKLGDRYITNFFIADRQTMLDMYAAQRRGSKERSAVVDKLADDMIPVIRNLNAVRADMTDLDIKWWAAIHTLNHCRDKVSEFTAEPGLRANGESWGFIGYEEVEFPEYVEMGMNGNGSYDGMFWTYTIGDYGMWTRIGEMDHYQAKLVLDMIKNNRNISSLSKSEETLWRSIDGKYAHADENGNVVPDILVFEKGAMDEFEKALEEHPLYAQLEVLVRNAYDKTKEILQKNSNKELHNQLDYYAGMFMMNIRMMLVHDEVDAGKLIVPEDPGKSRVAMWLEIE